MTYLPVMSSTASCAPHIAAAIDECRYGNHVTHISSDALVAGGDRAVAIRPSRVPGKLDLTFSDPQADLGNQASTLPAVTPRRAERLIQTFMLGKRVLEDQVFGLVINQGHRDCWIDADTITPTKVRIGYEMPNAGDMGSWVYATRLGNTYYIS